LESSSTSSWTSSPSSSRRITARLPKSESVLAVGPYGYVYTIDFLLHAVFSLVFIPARTIKAE
jgi:hypothetical protein